MEALATKPRTRIEPSPLGVEAPRGNLRFPHIDALRAGAALSVLAYHWVNAEPSTGGIVRKLAGHANFGVGLFFLISGFLLYRPYVTARAGLAPNPGLRSFYERRMLRILPAYWVALTVLAIYPGVAGFRARWWEYYAFGQVYDHRLAFTGGIPAAWSLCTEITFYALLPLYAYLLARLLGRISIRKAARTEISILVILSLVSVACHQVLHANMSLDSWAYALPGTFYLFAEGMALAVLSVLWQQHPGFWPSLKRVAPWGWALAAAAYVALAIKVPAATLGSVHPAWGLVALLVLLPATMTDIGGVPAVVMGFGVLRWLGLVSYAIYLWHQKVLEVTQRYVQSPWLTLLVVLIATTAIAAASYHFIERPFLRLKRRLATAAG